MYSVWYHNLMHEEINPPRVCMEQCLNTDTITLQSNNYPIAYFDIPISNKV